MLMRRKKLLQEIFNDLNQQAFQSLWQQLLVELAEIRNSIFENLFENIIIKYDDKGPTQELQRSPKHQKKV